MVAETPLALFYYYSRKGAAVREICSNFDRVTLFGAHNENPPKRSLQKPYHGAVRHRRRRLYRQRLQTSKSKQFIADIWRYTIVIVQEAFPFVPFTTALGQQGAVCPR